MRTCLMVAVIGLLMQVQSGADVNSQSMEATAWEPGHEYIISRVKYYVQTDKAAYMLGEPVQILFKVSNLGPREEVFWPFGPDLFDMGVLVHQRGVPVRSVSLLTDPTGRATLEPGQSFTVNYTWDMRDLHGDLIAPGNYDVSGSLSQGTVSVGVPVTIVPEPSALLVATAGGLFLMKRRRASPNN